MILRSVLTYAAVSYTHLDVYKRQTYTLAALQQEQRCVLQYPKPFSAALHGAQLTH